MKEESEKRGNNKYTSNIQITCKENGINLRDNGEDDLFKIFKELEQETIRIMNEMSSGFCSYTSQCQEGRDLNCSLEKSIHCSALKEKLGDKKFENYLKSLDSFNLLEKYEIPKGIFDLTEIKVTLPFK